MEGLEKGFGTGGLWDKGNDPRKGFMSVLSI